MEITIKLFAHYRDGRYESRTKTYPDEQRVGDIIQELNLDLERDPIGILLINGRHAHRDDPLHDGDTLAVFPMLGGG